MAGLRYRNLNSTARVPRICTPREGVLREVMLSERQNILRRRGVSQGVPVSSERLAVYNESSDSHPW